MGFYSIWPSLVCIGVLMALASTPLFSLADSVPTSATNRVRTLDGLRGFLALAVVFHHVTIYRGFLLREGWQDPPSQYYRELGPLGVSMFFMITGYLFWSRLRKDGGRPDWRSLYIGRIFRIGPLYLFAVGVATILDYLRPIEISGVPLALRFGPLLTLGVVQYQDPSVFLAGVTWSIRFEWFFYFSLPILAILARRPRAQLPFLGLTVLALAVARWLCHSGMGNSGAVSVGSAVSAIPRGGAWHPPVTDIVLLFVLGMLSASLKGKVKAMPDKIASALVISLSLPAFISSASYATSTALVLGAVFFLVTSGASIFGLLTTRSAIRLGDISYGIYLLQGLMLIPLRTDLLRRLVLSSPKAFWSVQLLEITGLAILAMLTHVWIEMPGVRIGRRFATTMRSRLGVEGASV